MEEVFSKAETEAMLAIRKLAEDKAITDDQLLDEILCNREQIGKKLIVQWEMWRAVFDNRPTLLKNGYSNLVSEEIEKCQAALMKTREERKTELEKLFTEAFSKGVMAGSALWHFIKANDPRLAMGMQNDIRKAMFRHAARNR